MAAMFEQAAGVRLEHIPYLGGAASLQAILSQQTDLNAAVSSTAAPMIQAGRLRPLAIIGEQRSITQTMLTTMPQPSSLSAVCGWCSVVRVCKRRVRSAES